MINCRNAEEGICIKANITSRVKNSLRDKMYFVFTFYT